MVHAAIMSIAACESVEERLELASNEEDWNEQMSAYERSTVTLKGSKMSLQEETGQLGFTDEQII